MVTVFKETAAVLYQSKQVYICATILTLTGLHKFHFHGFGDGRYGGLHVRHKTRGVHVPAPVQFVWICPPIFDVETGSGSLPVTSSIEQVRLNV